MQTDLIAERLSLIPLYPILCNAISYLQWEFGAERLSVAHFSSGPVIVPNSSFFPNFEQIAKHWSTNLVPEMTTEKLQALASSCIPSEEKEAILEIWNESRNIRLVHRFPISPFNNAAFILYLHKYVFWFQLKRAAVSLLAVLLKVARKTSICPSIEFEEYVDDYRALHWDYAFVDQIEAKEINKSWEWSNPKNVHGVPACWRLIYRYRSHVLLKEQVVKSQSSSFLT